METRRFFTLEKDEYKVFTFLGALLAFLIVTFLAYIVAQDNKTLLYVPLFILSLIVYGAALGNYIGRVLKNKKIHKNNQNIWNDDRKINKEKKSRFNIHDNVKVTVFGSFLSVFFSYLSIYLSEVLNLTKNLQREAVDEKFSIIFLGVFKDILRVKWAREYLIEYWLILSFIILIYFVAIIWALKKIKNLKREEERKKATWNKK